MPYSAKTALGDGLLERLHGTWINWFQLRYYRTFSVSLWYSVSFWNWLAGTILIINVLVK